MTKKEKLTIKRKEMLRELIILYYSTQNYDFSYLLLVTEEQINWKRLEAHLKEMRIEHKKQNS